MGKRPAQRGIKHSVLDKEGVPVWSLPANAAPDKKRAWERAMIEWIGDHFDWAHDKEMDEARDRYSEDDGYLLLALYLAAGGDYGPLRKCYPDLAEHLNPPKLGRGQKFKKPKDLDWVGLAAKDVPYVRRLCQKHYGKIRRRRGDTLSAEKIVAAYYTNFLTEKDGSVTEDAIRAA